MRTLIILSFLFYHTFGQAQIHFALEQEKDGITYIVKLKPDKSFTSPMNITNTAQISLVVPTGGFSPGNIQNLKGNWQNGNNVIAPISNPKRDYLIFNLVGHIKDLDYVEGEEVALFSFQNIGKKTGKPKFVTQNDIKIIKSKKLNIGNQISVLGAGFTNAFSGIYTTDKVDEEGPEMEDTQIFSGTFLNETFDLDLSVEKEGMALDWLADNKGKVKNYIIEKSMDGINFSAIKHITDNFEETIKEIDEAPDYGTNYYRIKQVYETGDYRYSTIQSEQFLIDDASITLYPNPVKDNLNVRIGHFAKLTGQIRLFNMSGIEMGVKPIINGNKQVRFNTTDFQNGIYFLIIESKNKKVVERQFIVENGK